MTLALAPYRITCAVQKTKHAADQAIRRLAHWRCYAAQHGTLPAYSALPKRDGANLPFFKMGNRNQLI